MIPVVLFCFNRPLHTQSTIESLLCNPEARHTQLYVFIDGPRNENDQVLVNAVYDVIDKVVGFKDVIVKKSTSNNGLANSVISGISEIIEKYERVIVLEDDMLTSRDFLFFMNKALDQYADHQSIGSVSGYSFHPEIPSDYNQDVLLTKRASSWGWGTWKDRWQSVDWELKGYDNFISDKSQIAEFTLGGQDLIPMIVKYKKGVIDSWAIRWTYHHYIMKQYCLVPVLSKIQNIGTDGSGTNFSTTETKYEVNFGEKEIKLPSSPKPNKAILESFKKIYRPSLYRRFINLIKYKVW